MAYQISHVLPGITSQHYRGQSLLVSLRTTARRVGCVIAVVFAL